MTSKSKTDIKAFFQLGDTPSESQFVDLIDSYIDKSGPLGVLETDVSAGSSGFVYASAGDADIISDAAALSKLGVTVYTTALASAVASDNINALYATTAQGNAGTATGLLMNPVLVKNAIATLAGGAMVLLGTATASNSATLDFTSLITATYSAYMFEFDDIRPATDNTELWFRTSTNNGSSYDEGASDYKYSAIYVRIGADMNVTGVSGDGTTKIALAFSVGNAAAEGISGTLKLRSPLGTARPKSVTFETTSEWTNGATYSTTGGSGVRVATADIDAVRFLMSSGNITSGKIRMYGVT